MFKAKKIKPSSKELPAIEKLYISAFPENERRPFDVIKNLKFYNSKLFAFYSDKKFVGFSFASFIEDFIYIVYIAVSDNERNKTYGSQIVNWYTKKFKHKTLVLSVEKPEQVGDIAYRRINHFYKRNGFKLVGFEFTHSGVPFLLLYKGTLNVEKSKQTLLINFPECKNFKDTDFIM